MQHLLTGPETFRIAAGTAFLCALLISALFAATGPQRSKEDNDIAFGACGASALLAVLFVLLSFLVAGCSAPSKTSCPVQILPTPALGAADCAALPPASKK